MRETKAIKLHSQATAMKCLGGKLEIVSLDPDPKAYSDLTREYNCNGCNDRDFCQRLERFIKTI